MHETKGERNRENNTLRGKRSYWISWRRNLDGSIGSREDEVPNDARMGPARAANNDERISHPDKTRRL